MMGPKKYTPYKDEPKPVVVPKDVSIPSEMTKGDVNDKGIKIRGTGAATKGLMARGPMA